MDMNTEMLNLADTVRQLRVEVVDQKFMKAVIGLDERGKDVMARGSSLPD